MKIPKDKLSTDMSGATRHSWIKGQWENGNAAYKERKDTCKHCGCKRIIIKFWLKGALITEVSSYERSGQSFGARQRPDCWRDKNPK